MNENLPNKVIKYINEFGYDETQYSANINLQQEVMNYIRIIMVMPVKNLIDHLKILLGYLYF